MSTPVSAVDDDIRAAGPLSPAATVALLRAADRAGVELAPVTSILARGDDDDEAAFRAAFEEVFRGEFAPPPDDEGP